MVQGPFLACQKWSGGTTFCRDYFWHDRGTEKREFTYLLVEICQDGDMRLVNGSGQFNGRLELCLNGAWGTVCNRQFNGPDAVVVCRSLGYSRFRKMLHNIASTWIRNVLARS